MECDCAPSREVTRLAGLPFYIVPFLHEQEADTVFA
jgi:hypothetical protein